LPLGYPRTFDSLVCLVSHEAQNPKHDVAIYLFNLLSVDHI